MAESTGPQARRRRLLRGAGALLLVLLGAVALVWFLFLRPQPLLPEAGAALAATPDVAFTDAGGYLSFAPAGQAPSTGLIIYPGARVPPAAYARIAREVAARGYRVVIVPMPLDLAILGLDRADGVRAAYPEVERWVLAGHSLGGAMACRYAARHPGAVAGLALWAAYCADDVSGQDLAATVIYGDLDAGAGRMESPATRALLPPGSAVARIPGGNHEQMGDYTGQPGDPAASIARDAQRAAVVDATLQLMDRVGR